MKLVDDREHVSKVRSKTDHSQAGKGAPSRRQRKNGLKDRIRMLDQRNQVFAAGPVETVEPVSNGSLVGARYAPDFLTGRGR